jgi:hypothetical protein
MFTTTTMRPGQKGTKGLTKKYGDRLICVRYKSEQATGRRITTVELIEEESDWNDDTSATATALPAPPQSRLGVRVEYWESDVRNQVKAAGGIWRPKQKLWEIRYEDVVALGLEPRVVGSGFSEA